MLSQWRNPMPIRYWARPSPWNSAPPWALAMRDMLYLIIKRQEIAMGIAQDLEDEVAAQSTVIGGVEVLVTNLIEEIRAAGTDKTKLEAVLVAAQANKTRLGALTAANTPANPEAVA